MAEQFDVKKYGCSVHGGDGDANCSECWARLGDLFGAIDEELQSEGKGGLNVVGDDETLEKLRQ